jgi:GAF domain-containing protein
MLGISTLCAAAIGNIISDLAGIGLGTAIEDFSAKRLNLPTPNLTLAQRKLRSVRFAGQFGMAVGMTFGCVLGMFPLFFIDQKKIQNLKKRAHLDTLFMDVVTEAKTLVGAESTCLYLRVTQDKEKQLDRHAHLPYCPSADGEYLYAMYYALPKGQKTTASGADAPRHQPLATEGEDSSRYLPLGKGIASRAIMTGLAWNIRDVSEEPDFAPEVWREDKARPLAELKHMVVVPVLDHQGRAIAVIRAMNKVQGENSGKGFTDTDVQILKALASHISVSLNSVYNDQGDEEVRLRDTIRVLKEQGIQGIEKERRSLTTLFPHD